MDNTLPFFNGQSRYALEINRSSVIADVLSFKWREALSKPFSWDIDFTTAQVLMKYACLQSSLVLLYRSRGCVIYQNQSTP